MIRVDFYLDDVLAASLGDDVIFSYSLSPAKFMASDYFATDPACFEFSCFVSDFVRGLPTDPVAVGDSFYTCHVVRVFIDDVLIMTGRVLAGAVEIDEKEESAKISVYDHLVILSELKDRTLRFMDGPVPEGSTTGHPDLTKYTVITNPDAEQTQNGVDPFIRVILNDRKLPTLIDFLFAQVNEFSPLKFTWTRDILPVTTGQIIAPHQVDDGDDIAYNSFFHGAVMALWGPAVTESADIAGSSLFCYWGLLNGSERWKVQTEFSILPPDGLDAILVVCAGFNAGPGAGFRCMRRFIVYGMTCGMLTWTSAKVSHALDRVYEGYVNTVYLPARTELALDADTVYSVSYYEDYDPAHADAYQYYCYHRGIASDVWQPSDIFFNLRMPYDTDISRRYIDMSIESLFKYLMFQADLTAYATPSGVIRITNKRLGADMSHNPLYVTRLVRKMFYCQPFKRDELKKIFTDTAFIDILIDYYGGSDFITFEINMDYFDVDGTFSPALGSVLEIGGERMIIVEIDRRSSEDYGLRLIRARRQS